MRKLVKDFLEYYIDLLDQDDLFNLFKHAVNKLTSNAVQELTEVLTSAGIQTQDARWKVFTELVFNFIEHHKNYIGDKSRSWARLDYMLDAIPTVGFTWYEAKQYVLDHQKDLGLECKVLGPEYGWQGSGDYAFQWFNCKAYDKEYSDD